MKDKMDGKQGQIIAAVFAALLAISETMGLTDKIKSNSIVQAVGGFFASLFKK